MRQLGMAVALALAVADAGPAWSAPSTEEAEAAAEAQRRGLAMYAADQAATQANARFREDAAPTGGIDALREKGLRGYVVAPLLDALEAVFYGESDGQAFALARYTWADGKIVGGGLLKPGEPDALSPIATRMIAALAKAGEAMAKPGHPLCSKSPPNSLVLPEGEGLSVYVLTSTTDPKVYPAGGHYRFDFDASGELTGERRFMTGCFPINLTKVPAGTRPTLLMTHLLDPQPTEVHSFVSLNVPLNLAVVTASNRYLWTVRQGKIAFLADKPPPGIPESAFKPDPAPEPDATGEPEAKPDDPVDETGEPEAEPEAEAPGQPALKSDEEPESVTDEPDDTQAPAEPRGAPLADPFKVDLSKLPPPRELPPGR